MNTTHHIQFLQECENAAKSRRFGQNSPQDNPAPHCTNPKCENFKLTGSEDPAWRREHGTYQTKAFGTVQRYRCLACGTTFSDQTFSMDYYVKKPVDYAPLLQILLSTSGQGNATRFTGLRYELIQNRYERLARMLLAFQAEHRSRLVPREDFAFDGFESFSRSQYYPNNINIVVGTKSEFIYTMGYSQLRRKGRMTEGQKARRLELEKERGKAPRNAVEKSARQLLGNIIKFIQDKDLGKKELRTDEHKAYVRALRSLEDADACFEHLQYSSKARRTRHNPLFPVNYVDRCFRKDLANHVRETLQFARCPAAMMVRLAIYQVCHNFLKPRRVREHRRGAWETRGEFLGLSGEEILAGLKDFWGRRVFLRKTKLWAEEKTTWALGWRNSRIPLGKRRVPAFACV